MEKSEQFELQIHAFSPESIPMLRLAEYMAEFARLLGEPEKVHFLRIRKGSTVIVHRVEPAAMASVKERARRIQAGDPPQDAKEHLTRLNRMLAEDNATGAAWISPDRKRLLEFRKPAVPRSFAPVTRPASLKGIVIRLGGKGDPVPVHLESPDGEVYVCEMKREKTKEISRFYLDTSIEVTGIGTWKRSAEGAWLLDSFRIHDFRPIADEPLESAVARARALPAAWKEHPDPLGALRTIRSGE